MTVHYGSPRRVRHWVSAASAPAAAFTANFLTGSVPTGITYSQATPYTYFNSSGLLVTSTGNRFDYDPVTLAAKGLLIEPATTNLVLQSNPVTANWTAATSTTLTGSAGYGPDNTVSASQITCATSGVTTGINIKSTAAITTTALGTYTFSAYLAYKTSRYVYVELTVAARQFVAFVIDLQTGTVTQTQNTGTQVTSVTSGIDAANNATVTTSLGTGYGYYRFWATFVTATATLTPSIGFVSAGTGNTFNGVTGLPTYTSTGTEGVNVYGVQVEASNAPTSLIPTTTATVTRGAGSIVNNGFSWYNSSASTAICVFDSVAPNSSGYSYPFSIGTATSNGISTAYLTTTETAFFDTNQVSFTLGTITRNTQAKVGVAYDGSTNAAVLNGGTVQTPGTQASVTTPTGLILGGSQGATNFTGHIKSFTYYGSRLSNSLLQSLTT